MRGPIKGFRVHVAWFVTTLAVAAVTLYLLLSAAGGVPSLDDPYRVQALVPTAVSIAPGATVRVAGLDVGQVAGVARRSGAAILDLELDDRYAPIPRDSRVEVRMRTVVGENYVELYPGTAGASDLANGGVLPRNRAVEAVQVDEILSVLDKDTRTRARQLIRGLGRGLDGRGEHLNSFFEELGDEVEATDSLLSVLARDRAQLAGFLDHFGAVMRAVGERGDALQVLAKQARVTAEAVARNDDDLRAMWDEFPPALAQARRTLATLRSTTGTTAPALTELAAFVREAAPVIDALGPAAREGRGLFRELGGAAPRLETMLDELREFSQPGSGAFPELRATLCDLNPLAAYLKPYVRDLGALTTGLADYSNWYDANGHAEREFDMVDETTVAAFDEETTATLQDLLKTGAVGQIHQKGYNPYPAPNEVSQPSTGDGATGPNSFKGKYPRVHAEC